jgi:hypothetical protein
MFVTPDRAVIAVMKFTRFLKADSRTNVAGGRIGVRLVESESGAAAEGKDSVKVVLVAQKVHAEVHLSSRTGVQTSFRSSPPSLGCRTESWGMVLWDRTS